MRTVPWGVLSPISARGAICIFCTEHHAGSQHRARVAAPMHIRYVLITDSSFMNDF